MLLHYWIKMINKDYIFVFFCFTMQLFVTDYTKHADTIEICNPTVLSQLRKVLRAKIGDIFWVQSPSSSASGTRYEVQLQQRDTTTLHGQILSEQHQVWDHFCATMIVAMPNKWEKVELIVQKLSEIGIQHIIFWPSERSVIKQWNHHKDIRLYKIIQEAVEQSRGWQLPELAFATDLSPYLTHAQVIIFDKSETSADRIVTDKPLVGVIGPEGGLTPKDYLLFAGQEPQIMSLGTTVLRMETAAIIGGWMIGRKG